MQPDKAPELILVTGERGSGKTSWCLELINAALTAGIAPTGILSPAVFDQGVKTAIDLVYIQSGERHQLAQRRGQPAADTLLQHFLLKGNWLFSTAVLEWGNQKLAAERSGQLLIVDELGPLELLDNLGFTAGIEQVNQRNFNLTCVTIRPSLLQNALERWPWARVNFVASPSAGETPL